MEVNAGKSRLRRVGRGRGALGARRALRGRRRGPGAGGRAAARRGPASGSVLVARRPGPRPPCWPTATPQRGLTAPARPPLTWPGRASHVRAVFTFGGARAPVGWVGA